MALNTTLDTTLHPALTHYIAWIKAHEKLLIIVLGAWLAFHFYGTALNAWEKHDERLATIAQQKVEVDATANKQLSQDVADLKQQLSIVTAQAQASQRQRQIDTNAQKQKNNNATPSEVATRIIQILRIQPQEVTASPVDGTLIFTPSAAHADVNALEDGIKAQSDVVDLTNELSACTAVVNKDDLLVAGLNTQLVDEKDSHKKDVDAEKVKTKKAWRNGFKWGYVGGLGTAIAIKIAKVF
jgi:hypothetical protein